MTWFEKLKLRIKFVTVFVAVLGPAFLIWMLWDSRRQLASYNWPETQGKVVAIRVKPWQDKDGSAMYFGRVAYTYELNGKIYSTDLTDLGPGWKHDDEASARADVSNYHPGDKVPVYYDPADPSVGVLEKGIPEFQKLLYIGLAVACAVAWLGTVFVVRSWLRSRRASKASAQDRPG